MRKSRILLAGAAALVALFVLFVLLKRDTKMPDAGSSASIEEQEYPPASSSARPSPRRSESLGNAR